MKITEDVKKRWNSLYIKGDYLKIIATMAKKDKVSNETLRRAFKLGDYKSAELLDAVASFYLLREANLPK